MDKIGIKLATVIGLIGIYLTSRYLVRRLFSQIINDQIFIIFTDGHYKVLMDNGKILFDGTDKLLIERRNNKPKRFITFGADLVGNSVDQKRFSLCTFGSTEMINSQNASTLYASVIIYLYRKAKRQTGIKWKGFNLEIRLEYSNENIGKKIASLIDNNGLLKKTVNVNNIQVVPIGADN